MSWKTFFALTLRDYSSENKTNIDPSYKFTYIIISTIVWFFSIVSGLLISYFAMTSINPKLSIKLIIYAGLFLSILMNFVITKLIKTQTNPNSYHLKNLDFQGALVVTSITIMAVVVI